MIKVGTAYSYFLTMFMFVFEGVVRASLPLSELTNY